MRDECIQLIINYLVCQFLIAYLLDGIFGNDNKLMDCVCSYNSNRFLQYCIKPNEGKDLLQLFIASFSSLADKNGKVKSFPIPCRSP